MDPWAFDCLLLSEMLLLMNVQELATIKAENLPVKVLLINNQYLGMVMELEERYFKANRADSYLGDLLRNSPTGFL